MAHCPATRGNQSKCEKCNYSHSKLIECCPPNHQFQRKQTETVNWINTRGVNFSRMVPVEITHPKAERPMRGFAIIDDQSSNTMLHPSAVEFMGLQHENLDSVTLATTTVHGVSAPERYPIVKGIQVKAMNAPNRDRLEMPEHGFFP